MAEKTEKATPKKLRDAKKKGQIAKAQDLPSAFTFIFSVAVAIGMSRWLYDKMSEFTIGTFKAITTGGMEEQISQLFMQSLIFIFTLSIPILLAVSFIGVAVTFLAVGPVFAPEVFKFDIKKFNPVENLKAKFKLKTLVELIKSLFKIFVATWLIYLVVYNSIPVLVHSFGVPIATALLIFREFLIEVVVKVGLLFIVIAAADFVYQKKSFAKEMMMEKFEVKQEYKNTEGDPQIKGRRRQMAQEIAYQDGPAAGVRRAQAVVTNPTHLAIALAYDSEVDPAPYILAMGEENLAKLIIKEAEKFNIPIMRNIPLAHELWDKGDLYEYVPEETYEAIAEVLRWVASLREAEFSLPTS